MENTLENRIAFLGLYIEQVKKEACLVDIRPSSIITIQIQVDKPIELTPLSQITDEDAIEVAKLQAPTFDSQSKVLRFDNSIEIHRLNYVVKITHEISTFHRGILLMVGGSVQNMYAHDCLVFIDYLRSRGYALPYLDASVEDLVKKGWVKLKSHE